MSNLGLEHDGITEYPVNPQAGLALRGLRGDGSNRFGVLVLRVRALIAGETGDMPFWDSIEIPGLHDRSITMAGAIPFCTASPVASDGQPSEGDTRVVRPVVSVRGPKTIAIGLPANEDFGFVGRLTGSDPLVSFDKFGHRNIYFQEDYVAISDQSPSANLTPTRVASIKDLGEDPDNSGSQLVRITLESGVSVKASIEGGTGGSTWPVIGQPWPPDSESEKYSWTVHEITYENVGLVPSRNCYIVPTLDDAPQSILGPIEEHLHPNTVMDYHDTTVKGGGSVRRVTLNSGATITREVTDNITIGEILDIATGEQTIPDQESIDPSEWWEFDVVLVTVPDQGDGSLGGVAPDVWPVFPGYVQPLTTGTGAPTTNNP